MKRSKKTFKSVMALILAATMFLQPAASIAVQAADGVDKTIRIKPAEASTFNDTNGDGLGEFQGFGTSLCWWANRVGNSGTLAEQAGELFFNAEKGLGMNIGRYNLGGGDGIGEAASYIVTPNEKATFYGLSDAKFAGSSMNGNNTANFGSTTYTRDDYDFGFTKGANSQSFNYVGWVNKLGDSVGSGDNLHFTINADEAGEYTFKLLLTLTGTNGRDMGIRVYDQSATVNTMSLVSEDKSKDNKDKSAQKAQDDSEDEEDAEEAEAEEAEETEADEADKAESDAKENDADNKSEENKSDSTSNSTGSETTDASDITGTTDTSDKTASTESGTPETSGPVTVETTVVTEDINLAPEGCRDYTVSADSINAGLIASNGNDKLFVATITGVQLAEGDNAVDVAGVSDWGLDFIKMAVIKSGEEGQLPEVAGDPFLHAEHIIRSDAGVPGYWKDATRIDLNAYDETYYADNFDQYDLDCGWAWNYDWNADSAQLNVLKSAIANAGEDFIPEVFSNSPPYFMTNSGCSSGNFDANVDNLRADSYVAFAKYMADVIEHLEKDEGIKVQSTTPTNEPYTNYWAANSNKQEGCHFDQGTSQSKIIVELNKQLTARGLDNIIISGTDETSIDTQISSYNALSDEAKGIVTRIDTHTYSGSKRTELKELAQEAGVNLWMSEVDGAFTGGTNSGEMSAAIGLAQRMFTDINGLEASAWILWNAIDMHADSSEYGKSWVNKGSNNDYLNMTDLKAAWQKKSTDGYWGLAAADHNNDEIVLTQKYYAFGQLSRYIRPGMTIIGSSDEDNTLVAYDSENEKVVIVSINDKASDRKYKFDLSLFNDMESTAKVNAYRTSGSLASGEHWADVTRGCAIALDVANKNFTATAKANSITTYVVEGVTFDAGNPVVEDNLEPVEAVTGTIHPDGTAELPKTVEMTNGDITREVEISWYPAEADYAGKNFFETVEVEGVAKDNSAITLTAKAVVVPKNLEYFVDCNPSSADTYKIVAAAEKNLINKDVADQKKTADNSWGYTEDYGKWDDSYVNWSGWYAYKNQFITYTFKLPAGTHTITTGMQGSWWNDTRAQSYFLTVDGGASKQIYTTPKASGTQRGNYTFRLGEDSEVTLTVKATGKDPVLSWILINSMTASRTSFTGVAGEQMYDTDGNRIQAHGGQIQKVGDTYYWIGEDKSEGAQPCYGVHMYSSQDLYNWTDEGVVLKTMTSMDQFENDEYFKNLYAGYSEEQKAEVFKDLAMGPDSNGAYNAIIERPKFLYNEKTGKSVMWFHCDGRYPNSGATSNYGKARAGIAIADSPAGPYKYVGSYLLATGTATGEADHSWDAEGGHVRDMNLFKDDDGTAYVMYSSEGNAIMYIARLNEDYTGLAKDASDMVYGEDFIIASTDSREAPAMFKYNGKYYLLTSGCTGWAPNRAAYAVADDILGEWTRMGDPCVDTGNSYPSVNGVSVNTSTTWYTQPTCVIPVDAAAGKFIYMGDRWYNPDNNYDITDSRYVWLPIEFSSDDSIAIKDYSNWTLEDLNGKGAISFDDIAIPTVVSSAAELEGKLPATLDFTVGGESYENSPVTWTVDEADVALGDNKIGYTAATGFAPELNRSFKVWILTAPENLVYFADCYTNNDTNHSDMFDLLKANTKHLMNSVSDQAKAKDGDATWGYTSAPGASGASSSEDMGSKGEGDFFATGWWATSKGTITYSYTLPAGTYDIATGFNEWWSATRGMKISAVSVDANGIETELKSMSFTLKNETELEKVMKDVTVPEGSDHVLVKVSKASGADPILSWMAIRAQDDSVFDALDPVKKSVVASFSFDDVESGFTSNGYTAELVNGEATLENSNHGKAIVLNNRKYLKVKNAEGRSPLDGLDEVTISYYSLPTAGGGWALYAAKDDKMPQGWSNEYYLGILDNQNRVLAERYFKSRGDNTSVSAEATGLANEARFVTLVVNKDSVKVYINGLEAASATRNTVKSLSEILGTESIMQIGKAQWGEEYYVGTIDEYTIYNRALTPREIAGLAGVPYKDLWELEDGVKTEGQLLAHYTFGDIAANNPDKVSLNDVAGGVAVKDSSGNGNDAVLVGDGAMLRTDALILPGSKDNNEGWKGVSRDNAAYVDLPVGMFKDENGKPIDTITVNMWMQNYSQGGDWCAFYMGTDARYNQDNVPLNYLLVNPAKTNWNEKPKDAKFKACVTHNIEKKGDPYNSEDGIVQGATITAARNTSCWQMYTVVVTPHELYTYLDGVFVNRIDHGMSMADWTDGTNATPELLAYIGKAGYVNDELWSGAVKDCRIYDYALDSEAVAALYEEAVAEPSKEAVKKAVTVDKVLPSATIGAGSGYDLPDHTSVNFTDGTTNKAYLTWKDEKGNVVDDTSKLDAGVYNLTATVEDYFASPFLAESADPQVYFDEQSGLYFFTCSDPAYGSIDNGYNKISLRVSKTLQGLKDANPVVIWDANDSSVNKYGKIHIWAPEIHRIGGKFYIYFAGAIDGGAWNIRPRVLICDIDDDNMTADELAAEITKSSHWTEHERFTDKDGGYEGFNGMSLDMTYFEANGKSYVIWADIEPRSMLKIATVDPKDPTHLTSDALIIAYPEYSWERINENVDEGPSVLIANGRINVVFSASGTGPEYAMGLLSAAENADLLEIRSWTKQSTPILQSSDLVEKYGPGHNSFTYDESGNAVLVYHARDERCYSNKCDYASKDSLYDPCRHCYMAYVRFDEDGNLVLSSTANKELASLKENTVTFTLTVSDKPDEERVEDALNAIMINGLDDVRGNLVLPTEFKGVKISWKSSDSDIITDSVVDGKAPGLVTRPSKDVKVTLTATASVGAVSASKSFEANVKAAPKAIETTDYLFAYFMGEGYATGEQIYFSASQDGLNWKTLNGGEPVITSELGEKGLRDPFIMRSHEGDKFYLIATDLKINGSGDWTKAQEAGSTSIMVWESTDLVNWSAQRMCEIAPKTAGCTWAPEAFWDDQTQDYVVFWASKTAADNYSKQRIYKCHTRDFYTYSEPELWIEFKDASGNVKSIIDTTMIKVGDTYYRISKNEEGSKVDGINGKSVFLEKSDSIDGTWTRIASDSLNAETGVEGATSFKFNADDADGDKWCILVDNNGGVGYYPLVTGDLESGSFTKLGTGEYDFKARLRHGSVLNLTSEEYANVMKAYGNVAEESTKTESAEKSLVANITFKDGKVVDETGLSAGEIHGNVTIDENGVATFDGRSYISLTKADGTALLDGIGEEITIAYTSKTNNRGSGCGWTVFASKNDKKLIWQPLDETYIGVMDKTDGLEVERFNVARGNADSYKASGIAGRSDEKRVVITMGRQEIRIYENGEEVFAGKNKNLASLSSMFGADSIFWIGKANWGNGEFFNGTMTDLQVYSKLLSADEIAQIYAGTDLPVYPEEPVIPEPTVTPLTPGSSDAGNGNAAGSGTVTEAGAGATESVELTDEERAALIAQLNAQNAALTGANAATLVTAGNVNAAQDVLTEIADAQMPLAGGNTDAAVAGDVSEAAGEIAAADTQIKDTEVPMAAGEADVTNSKQIAGKVWAALTAIALCAVAAAAAFVGFKRKKVK